MASPTLGAAGEDERNQKLQELPSKLSKLCDAFHAELDSNRAGRDELDEILKVLEVIKAKMSPPGDGGKKVDDDQLLPVSKKEELAALLPTIERALKKRRPPPQRRSSEAVERPPAERKTGCSPLKLRPSQRQRHGGGGGGRREEEGDDEVPLKLLLRLAQHVLEPEEYYEWTTSYVDESRIFGWDKEAGDVVDALVGPKDGGGGGGQRLFRAAGIAGIHGSGKTALAQKVFVHDDVKDHFPLRLWVCVGPPDSEDRFCLLYRMLDNLGLDTHKVEFDIVGKCQVVAKHREEEEARIRKDRKAMDDIEKKAAKERDDVNKDATKKAEGTAAGEPAAKEDHVDDDIFKKVLRETVESTAAVEKSKIGVLLYILHEALSKTGYLIVFDDIRVYGDDGWYSNLTLEPPAEGEWTERLAYGLPKTTKHRSAVLVTCRREEHARAMVRAGRVFSPPRLEVDQGWQLFKREYGDAKKLKDAKSSKDGGGGAGKGEDLLLKDLEEMKEQIVKKCLGLPVAIIEAAKGYALSDFEPLPDPPSPPEKTGDTSQPAADQAVGSNKNSQAEATADAAAGEEISEENT